jgi:hypothetical protein
MRLSLSSERRSTRRKAMQKTASSPHVPASVSSGVAVKKGAAGRNGICIRIQ